MLRLKAMGGTETPKEIAASCEDKRVTEKMLSKWKIKLQDERAKAKAEGGKAEGGNAEDVEEKTGGGSGGGVKAARNKNGKRRREDPRLEG